MMEKVIVAKYPATAPSSASRDTAMLWPREVRFFLFRRTDQVWTRYFDNGSAHDAVHDDA